MKGKQLTALLVAGLFCAFALPADEAWRTKPSADWDQKDIRQILEHSAWAHRVSVVLVRPAGEVAGCVGSSGPCQRDDSFRAPKSPSDSSSTLPDPPRVGSDLSSQSKAREMQGRYSGSPDSRGSEDSVVGVAVVRWASARTVREALGRMVPPSGKLMEPEELAQLAPADAYVVYVDLRVAVGDVSRVPQNGMLTQHIARQSFLLAKSAGQRIPAARVVSAPLPEFDDRKELALAAYYIFFPRQRASRASLPRNETEVRFECPLAPVPIHADFKLSHMERDGAPDY